MMRGMLSAVSGLKAHEEMLDVIANNIANVNTIGYKSSRISFEDAFSQTLRASTAPTGGIGGTDATQIGLGVNVGGTENQMTEGSVQNTGVPTDCAIQGDGYFRVATYSGGAFGTPMYTRNGDFTTDVNGNLMTRDGYYVIGYGVTAGAVDKTKTALINVPPTAASVAIGTDGTVTTIDGAGNQTVQGAITMAKFPNENALERQPGSLFTAPLGATGPETVAQPGDAVAGTGSLIPGSLEMSNVDLAQEFTNMITAERGFQANSRAITTADEMLQELVNIIK